MNAVARELGEFVHALHHPAPIDAPHNPWRGVPLVQRSVHLVEHLQRVDPAIDRSALLRVWDQAIAARPWHGPPLWIHGDMHPGNLLINKGRLAGVIDFGDLTAGDPATDLAVIWIWLPAASRHTFVSAARNQYSPIDDHMLARARGWALAMAIAVLAAHDPVMADVARRTIAAALAD